MCLYVCLCVCVCVCVCVICAECIISALLLFTDITMAWLWMCCQPCQVCWAKCRDKQKKKYPHVEYNVLKEAPLATIQKLNQVVQMQETANVYLPHLVPKVSRFTGQPSATVDSGETSVQFSLYYDIQRCTLDVQLIEVSNLPDIGGKCSSKVYVLLSSLKLERWIESMVASNSQSPAFNQTLEFHGVLLSELKDMLIAFQIHHYSANHSNNVFGVAKMLLKDADIYGACTTLGITLGQKLKQVSEETTPSGGFQIVTSFAHVFI